MDETSARAVEWVTRFVQHIRVELRSPLDGADVSDWAWAIYPDNAAHRPEDVAQREWAASSAESLRELQDSRDEQRASQAQSCMF